MIELSTKPFEHLLFWTCWKTAYAVLYLNTNASAKYKDAKCETSRVGQVPAAPLRNINLRQLKNDSISMNEHIINNSSDVLCIEYPYVLSFILSSLVHYLIQFDRLDHYKNTFL